MSDFSSRGVSADLVAVVAMSGRYPGAEHAVDGLWDVLKAGESRIRRVPQDRWDVDAALGSEMADACRNGSFLADVAGFDADFFGMTPEAAAMLDPQVRLFLEVAWEALEIAGYAGDRQIGRRAGIWVGYGHDHYRDLASAAGQRIPGFPASIGLAGKFSAFADWRGPSVVVNALCASSLLAVHQAVASLRAGECDMALVGGVSAALSPAYYRDMNALGVLSPTGESKPFDAGANGFVPGEGVGAVVLKRLDDARRDGDRVVAVIRGTAVNHGGQSSRLFAMNLDSQVSLLNDLFERSGIPADSIGYVEAHAVGTRLGDAVEVAALSRVFASDNRAPGYCAIGSLKPVLGHMEAASGIAALQKALLSLDRRELLPTVGVNRPNSTLKPGISPLRLLDETVEWPAGETARRACVMSMSMHGVNAAVVLEESPSPPPKMFDSGERQVQALLLSASAPEALAALLRRYCDALAAPSSSPALGDLCFTAAVGRAELPYRAVAAGDSVDAIREALASLPATVAAAAGNAKFALHYGDIAEEDLPGQADTARRQLQTLKSELAARSMDRELQRLEAWRADGDDPVSLRLAIVARDVARSAVWHALGVVPECVLGNGMGAVTAACVAGLLPPDQAAPALEAIVHGGAIDIPPSTGEDEGERDRGENRRPTLLSPASGQPVERLDGSYWVGSSRGYGAGVFDEIGRQGVGVWLTSSRQCAVRTTTGHPGAMLDEQRNDAIGRRALGVLWSAGVAVRWREIYRGGRHGRVPLPTYPFQRKQHWFERSAVASEPVQALRDASSAPASVAVSVPTQAPAPAAVPESAPSSMTPRERIAALVSDSIAAVRRDCAGLAHDRNFLEAGLDSANLTATTQLVSERLGVELSSIFLFEHASIQRAATFLLETFPTQCAASMQMPAHAPSPASDRGAAAGSDEPGLKDGSSNAPASSDQSKDAMHAMLVRMEARIRALEESGAVS